jgi:hypothetical protein
MADIDEFKPRRKLVTYGKHVKRVQKNDTGFDSITASSTPNVNLPFNGQIPADRHRRIDANSEGSSSDAVSASTKKMFEKKQASARTKVEADIGELGRLNRPSHRSKLKGNDPGVFDVPSSSDEGFGASGTGTPRKRRRLSPVTTITRRTVFDEESLQRHIALETAIEPPNALPNTRASTKPTKAQKRSATSTNAPLRATKSRTASVDARASVIRDTSLGSRSSGTSSGVGATSKEAGKARAQENDPDRLLRSSRRGRSQTPRTPSPPVQSRMASSPTPRQATLLNELLGDTGPENSPSRLGLKRLTLMSSAEVSRRPRSTGDPRPTSQSTGTAFLREAHRPRRRLIDALGKSNAESISQSSEEESSDDGSESSPPEESQHIPKVHVEESDVLEKKGKPMNSEVNDLQTQSLSQPTGPIRTYAKQRSYLSETALDEIEALKDPAESQLQPHGVALGGGSQVSLALLIEDEDVSGVGAGGGLRSIHELRQAGGNARVLSDIESILEDIEDLSPGSSSRRRGGLIELCTKVLESGFARQFLDNAMAPRFIMSASAHADNIMTFLTASAISLLLCSGPVTTTDARACSQTILKICPSLLGEQRDLGIVTRERKFNLSKATRASLIDLQASVNQSRIWTSERPQSLSPQIMALRSLDLAIRRLREMGDLKETLPSPTIKQLIGILVSKVSQQRALYSIDDFIVIQLTVSILESYSIAIGAISEDEVDVVEDLSGVGPLLSLGTDGNEEYAQVQILALRLILNVTNNNPVLCERFATPELVTATFRIVSTQFSSVSEEILDGKESSVLDAVLLALGSLINFTEWSGVARNLMAQLEEGSVPFLDVLLGLFLVQVDEITKVPTLLPSFMLRSN